MRETSMLSHRALQAFAAWSGFPVFADVIRRVPDLDIYLAGGAVRNLALGQEKVRDFDLFLGGPALRGHEPKDLADRSGKMLPELQALEARVNSEI